MSRTNSNGSLHNSQSVHRMLYDSFDNAESVVVQQVVPTLKRSLSYVDTRQESNNTTSWLQQISTAHSDNGGNNFKSI